MIDAGMLAGIAGHLAPNHGTAMGAAIDQSVNGDVRVAVHDDRSVADIGSAEIARVGDFGLKPKKIPGRATKDPLLLALVRLGIVIKAVRYPAGRPDRGIQHLNPPHIPRSARRRRSSAHQRAMPVFEHDAPSL